MGNTVCFLVLLRLWQSNEAADWRYWMCFDPPYLSGIPRISQHPKHKEREAAPNFFLLSSVHVTCHILRDVSVNNKQGLELGVALSEHN